MPSTVFVTGGSGFVGSAVVRELLSRGYGVRALVHRRPLDVEGVESVTGSVTDWDAVRAAMAGCEAVVHLVGIIRERPHNQVTFDMMHFFASKVVLIGARDNGVKRYVHMSALGTRPDAVSEYHRTKWKAEEYVRGSKLDWTILRPSMIHGPGGEFTTMEAAWARGKTAPYFFMPYFGRGALGLGGAGKLQPVFVGDVARAFVDAIEKPQTIRQTYDLVGPETMTWPEMHRAASKIIVGRRRRTMAIPAWYAKLLTRVVPASLLPFNRDQVVMSGEDNVGELEPFQRDFGWEPRSFTATLGEYATTL